MPCLEGEPTGFESIENAGSATNLEITVFATDGVRVRLKVGRISFLCIVFEISSTGTPQE